MTHNRLVRWGAALVAATALTAGLAACSSGDPEPIQTSTVEVTPQMRLEAVKLFVDQTRAVHVSLTSNNVPEGAVGVTGANGVLTHQPAFQGKVVGKIETPLGNFNGDVEATSLGGRIWIKAYGFESEFSPEQLGIDPATLFTPERGITTLLPVTGSAVFGDDQREGSEVLATITGTLPGDKVADVLNVGDRAGTFTVTYGIVKGTDELRRVQIVGPFFDGESTYTVLLDQYGQPADITR